MYRQTVLPMYRGFNLSYLMCPQDGEENAGQRSYREKLRRDNPISFEIINSDLEMISDLGFNFVRFPLNYVNFISNYADFWSGAEFEFDEKRIEVMDKSIKRAEELGLYVQFALHRAPGYTVGGENLDPYKLWFDEEANDAFVRIWKSLTQRYKSVPSQNMGFNLVNEPWSELAGEILLPKEKHNVVMRRVVEAIRGLGDERQIFLDGMNWGRDFMLDMCDMAGVAQSCRAYDPTPLTHYGMDAHKTAIPIWPGMKAQESHTYNHDIIWDKERIYIEFEQWARMAQEKNVGVHCGEGGVCCRTPRGTAIAWFYDVMEALTYYNIGFAMWELRGIFGIVDSGRTDCKLMDYKGHMLDMQMLEIMKMGF